MRSHHQQRRSRDREMQLRAERARAEKAQEEAAALRAEEEEREAQQEAAKAACREQGHNWAQAADGTIRCLQREEASEHPGLEVDQEETEKRDAVMVDAPVITDAGPNNIPIQEKKGVNPLLLVGAAAGALLLATR